MPIAGAANITFFLPAQSSRGAWESRTLSSTVPPSSPRSAKGKGKNSVNVEISVSAAIFIAALLALATFVVWFARNRGRAYQARHNLPPPPEYGSISIPYESYSMSHTVRSVNIQTTTCFISVCKRYVEQHAHVVLSLCWQEQANSNPSFVSSIRYHMATLLNSEDWKALENLGAIRYVLHRYCIHMHIGISKRYLRMPEWVRCEIRR